MICIIKILKCQIIETVYLILTYLNLTETVAGTTKKN